MSVRCLTCKHRHKKCDQRRPVCDRCSKGGYECLGYERNNSNAYGHSYDDPLPSDHPNSIISGSGYSVPGSSAPSLSPQSEGDTRSDESLTANVTTTSKIRITDGNLKAGALIQSGTAHGRQDLSGVFGFSDRDAVVYDTFPPTRPKTQAIENEVTPPLHSAGSRPPVFPTNPLQFEISSRMLKDVPMALEVRGVVEYVISHSLWPTQHDPTLVSMAHVLACPRYSPACYMAIDVMGSMVYGLPQLVDYNTHIELFHPEPHPMERFSCFPGEFVVLLAKINACRDQTSTEGWQSIERQLVSWESRPQFVLRGLESWKLVAWLGLQEAWRHTLLIYLYLAVCGVATDDPRIRTSSKQVFQLMGVIKRQDPPVLSVHALCRNLLTHRKAKEAGTQAAGMRGGDTNVAAPSP
ncbi:hypothetical protein BN14_11030 [Rhizoctonia solani AG-1 IB]|uniref:Zn(2)-C6 fungal-type domain-containing protein n=1 Tax=Thanatephorus cucumeris (strain AG1-IB / isolate 7/3/14) TaxID=1108050 RepID=M5CA35_THACB|nr:hypothetical protein BN14_11030 [Rhizoctonia solani AG-1 IB]